MTKVIRIRTADQLSELPAGTVLHAGPLGQSDRYRELVKYPDGTLVVADASGSSDYQGTHFDELYAIIVEAEEVVE